MGTQIVGCGVYEHTETQVDPVHRALRVSLRPPESGTMGAIMGSYRKVLKSGVIAAGIAANSPVWECRWGGANLIAIPRLLRIQAIASTTAFAATAADSSFSLFRAQGFQAMDGTGATFAQFTKGKSGSMATRMASSQFAGDTTANRTAQGGIAIANTGALSAGTRINDDDPIGAVWNRIAASAAAETILTPEPPPYLIDPSRSPALAPVELQNNEGLVLMADAITATGTWRLLVEFEWDEVDPERYFG